MKSDPCGHDEIQRVYANPAWRKDKYRCPLCEAVFHVAVIA